MVQIPLDGPLGLDESITVQDAAAFAKYFHGIPRLHLLSSDLAAAKDLTLADPKITALSSGIDFDRQVLIGPTSDRTTINPDVKAAATIAIIAPKKDDDGKVKPSTPLFDPDPCHDPIAFAPGQRYVSFSITGTVDPSVTLSNGDLCFGVAASASIALRSFARYDAGLTLLEAVKQTVQNFQIPGGVDDLIAMQPASVATVEGTGSLKLSATFSYKVDPNPLVQTGPTSPVDLSVTGGPAVSVPVSVTFKGGYQVRAYKLNATTARVGIARTEGSEWDVSVKANAGVYVEEGDTDVIGTLFSLISPDAKVSESSLRKAGLADPEVDAVKATIKAGLSRSLEASMQSALARKSQQSDAFLYEIDLTRVDEGARDAVHQLLNGDLTSVTGRALPAGITAIRRVVDDSVGNEYTLTVNLLGIWNFIDKSSISTAEQIVYDGASGDITITDRNTATTVAATVVNGARQADASLRTLLYSSAVATAAYCYAGLVVSESLSITVRHFLQQRNPDRPTIREQVNLGVGLGKLSPAAADAIAAASGLMTCNATLKLEKNAVDTWFDPAGDHRRFENIGRQALAALLDGIDAYKLRHDVAAGDNAWNAVAGNENNIGPALRAIGIDPGVYADVIGADFRAIESFANSSVDAIKAAHAVAGYLAGRASRPQRPAVHEAPKTAGRCAAQCRVQRARSLERAARDARGILGQRPSGGSKLRSHWRPGLFSRPGNLAGICGAAFRLRRAVSPPGLTLRLARRPDRPPQADSLPHWTLSKIRKPCVKHVVVHSRIHRRGECVGDVEEPIAQVQSVPAAPGTPLYAPAEINQKIKGGSIGDILRNALGGCDNSAVYLEERIKRPVPGKVDGEACGRDPEAIDGVRRHSERHGAGGQDFRGLQQDGGGHGARGVAHGNATPRPAAIRIVEAGGDEAAAGCRANQRRGCR